MMLHRHFGGEEVGDNLTTRSNMHGDEGRESENAPVAEADKPKRKRKTADK